MYELIKILSFLKTKKYIFYICFNSDYTYLQLHLNKVFLKGIDLITFKIYNYDDNTFLVENKELIEFIKNIKTQECKSNILSRKNILKDMKENNISKDVKKYVLDCLDVLENSKPP